MSVLYFLKTVHPDEWFNFLERVGLRADEETHLFTDRALALELRLWASNRGQTLSRTVDGMMLHERALKLLASWEGLSGAAITRTVVQKFTYVVSCQAYSDHKRSRDSKAADTEFLLQASLCSCGKALLSPSYLSHSRTYSCHLVYSSRAASPIVARCVRRQGHEFDAGALRFDRPFFDP